MFKTFRKTQDFLESIKEPRPSGQLVLKFLVPAEFADYDLCLPPSYKNTGSSVAIKYARIEDIIECNRVSKIEDAKDADLVFADWLWFVAGQDINLFDQAKSFVDLPCAKVLYGSELSVLGWPRQLVHLLSEEALISTYNTEYQRRLYRTIGIYNSRLLSDPVPPLFFPDPKKRLRLVCVGQINDAKNSSSVLKIFEQLKGKIELAYVGGASMWGQGFEDKISGELHHKIAALSDIFIENATEAQVAVVVNESSYFAHVTYHDVSSVSQQEAMSSANVTFALGHPLMRERTPYRFANAKELAQAVLDYPYLSEQHETDMIEAMTVAEAWSYEAWEQQVKQIMRLGGISYESDRCINLHGG